MTKKSLIFPSQKMPTSTTQVHIQELGFSRFPVQTSPSGGKQKIRKKPTNRTLGHLWHKEVGLCCCFFVPTSVLTLRDNFRVRHDLPQAASLLTILGDDYWEHGRDFQCVNLFWKCVLGRLETNKNNMRVHNGTAMFRIFCNRVSDAVQD